MSGAGGDAGAAQVVLASANAGKLREMRSMLRALAVRVVPQSAYDVPAVDESGLTFVENAILKARRACEVSGAAAIGDDSGLVVDALDGAPGIRSARYAGTGAADADNIRKLLDELCGIAEPQRCARFYCAMVYLRHSRDPAPIVCDGIWEGRILEAPRGRGGFGYDPVFFVPTHGCTAAELDPATKNALSHRGQAMRALVARLGA